jgi:tetratricopeptide (TPR) repeat protein
MPYDLTRLQGDIAQVQHTDSGFGTGRLVAENLILTTAHTLYNKETGTGPHLEGWQVRLARDRSVGAWPFRRANRVAWHDQECDIALIQLVNPEGGPLRPELRLRVATVLGNNPHPVEARGYPNAAKLGKKSKRPRELTPALGRLTAADRDRPLCFGIDHCDLPNQPHADWPGMSGSAVLLHDCLNDPETICVYGVVQYVPANFDGQLRVARLADAWQNATFRGLLIAAGAPDKEPEDPLETPSQSSGRALSSQPFPIFRSNIRTRRNLPFIGRDDLLEKIRSSLGDTRQEAVVVLHGQPGVGKSELAQEFARLNRDRYPGGTFFIEAGQRAVVVDLARIGQTLLGLEMPPSLSLEDQSLRTLQTLGAVPSLLIYDNVPAEAAVLPWLPPAGMPCHVLMTTVLDRWDAGWLAFPVEPLSARASVGLIEGIAGNEVAVRYGARLAELAGGLPVQIVPAAAILAYEARRGRLNTAVLTLTQEAQESFLGVYQQLELPARLLLHAAARLNPQRIAREELQYHLTEAVGWSASEFQRWLDTCLDLHVLQDGVELRMHQLFATFITGKPPSDEIADSIKHVMQVQVRRMIEISRELATDPHLADLAAKLMAFSPDLERWGDRGTAISIIDGETVGQALLEIGQFEAARPWYERAVAEKEQGDVHGRIDHASLGISLYKVGYCLWSRGQFEAAQPWLERAVAAAEQGDIHSRVDHASLGSSLHQVGYCLSSRGQFEAAQPWYERAVAEKEQGDIHSRVDHASLGSSLHIGARCLRQLGRYEEATAWETRAFEATP